mmetsp:Transcript_144956/g.263607  ORF Transcript_144956/g.263607 Transcript_144956/m.263607 type:complete len:248 (-) Transcript_144956:1362-2105(-)
MGMISQGPCMVREERLSSCHRAGKMNMVICEKSHARMFMLSRRAGTVREQRSPFRRQTSKTMMMICGMSAVNEKRLEFVGWTNNMMISCRTGGIRGFGPLPLQKVSRAHQGASRGREISMRRRCQNMRLLHRLHLRSSSPVGNSHRMCLICHVPGTLTGHMKRHHRMQLLHLMPLPNMSSKAATSAVSMVISKTRSMTNATALLRRRQEPTRSKSILSGQCKFRRPSRKPSTKCSSAPRNSSTKRMP